MRQLVYTTLLLIITLLFTCDEMKICSDIKMSQNIMNMIAELYQNSAQMISGKHQKFWKIVRKTYVVEFPLNRVVRILPDCTADTFWKCSERKGCLKNSKFQNKSLQNCPFFSNATALDSRISEFSKYRLKGKRFL